MFKVVHNQGCQVPFRIVFSTKQAQIEITWRIKLKTEGILSCRAGMLVKLILSTSQDNHPTLN
jgi:hypothetical protein